MSKRIYTVVLQSAIGDGPSISNDTFFYDWSKIPDVPYYVRFSFVSAQWTTTQVGQMASVYIDLSQPYNQLAKAQSSAQIEQRGQFLGNLLYAFIAANNCLCAENNTNPPTYLNGRPKSNNFTVEIRSTPTTYYTPFGGIYCLILSFREC